MLPHSKIPTVCQQHVVAAECHPQQVKLKAAAWLVSQAMAVPIKIPPTLLSSGCVRVLGVQAILRVELRLATVTLVPLQMPCVNEEVARVQDLLSQSASGSSARRNAFVQMTSIVVSEITDRLVRAATQLFNEHANLRLRFMDEHFRHACHNPTWEDRIQDTPRFVPSDVSELLVRLAAQVAGSTAPFTPDGQGTQRAPSRSTCLAASLGMHWAHPMPLLRLLSAWQPSAALQDLGVDPFVGQYGTHRPVHLRITVDQDCSTACLWVWCCALRGMRGGEACQEVLAENRHVLVHDGS
jgi:hypothetical protein